MIYTSYFGNMRYLPEYFLPVAISLGIPAGLKNIIHYKKLAPTWDILDSYKTSRNEEEYIKRFNSEVLSKLNPVFTYKELNSFLGEDKKNIVLLCYEKNGFCHRNLVRDWFNANSLPVLEFDRNLLGGSKNV